MEIKVAFYKGRGDLFNKIVRWWTKSPYSHTELILPDGVTWIRIGPFSLSKLSAIKRENWEPQNWDFVTLKVNYFKPTLRILNMLKIFLIILNI